MSILTYLFWPNPANATYGSPKVVALLILCALLIVASFGVRVWRKRTAHSVTKKLSRSWPSALLWFAITGIVLVVSRVEQIGYVSMRLWWLVWAAVFIVYIWLQIRQWKARHYEIIPGEKRVDPRAPYLPGKKRR